MVSSTITLNGIAGRKITIPTGLFINNEFVPSSTNDTLETLNPATGEVLANISSASSKDIDLAVAAAKNAFENGWKQTAEAKRRVLLFKLAELIERDAEEFATIEALDAGVLHGECLALSVPQGTETLRYFAGWADKIDGKSLNIPGGMAYTRREAIGVCGAIVPWNSPLMITCWKLAPCLAAGNVIVIKTPELAPLYGIKLASLIKEAGFPPGVVNIVTGIGSVAGQALAEHNDVKKLAFTGSGPVGRGILKASANTNLKKVTLELGGKGASIIFDDADLDNAVLWSTIGITAHNGQICAAGSRIYVQESIYDQFVARFKEASANAVAGDPLLSTTTKGPVISATQHKKILGHIQNGQKEGVSLLHGGKAIGSKGYFVENTAFTDVGDDKSIMREEIFGPVASIASFKTESQVIALSNSSVYGLSSAIFTSDVSRAVRVSHALESGQVTINSWGMLSANTPFGGVKQSGFGRDMGEDALEAWTNVKAVKFALLPEKLEKAKI